MAIESLFTRIYAALTEELSGFSLTADEKTALTRAVLESDLAEYRDYAASAVELTFDFRASEAPHYRVRTNAILDDRFRLLAAGTNGVLETEALDLSQWQLMAAKVSGDIETGAVLSFDLCVDADPDDATLGSFLAADEGKTLAFDTEIALDVYPTDHLVLRLTLAGNSTAGARAVRMRLTRMRKNLTAQQVSAIAKLSAIRYLRPLENKAVIGGSAAVLQSLQTRIANLAREARGVLVQKEVSGNLGGPVTNENAAENPYWGRLKN